MPQAVATWVVTTFFAVGATTAVGAMAFAYWAAYLGTTLIITAGLAAVSKSMLPKPKILRGMTQEYGGQVEPRRIIYGTVRVSGMNVIPPITTGTEGQYLHQALAIAGHAVSGYGSVFFDQTEIENGDIGSVTGVANDGVVTSGDYNNKAWIRRYNGTQTSSDYILFTTPSWGSGYKGQGVAYLAIQYLYDAEIYKNGKPEVSVVVNGKKCYDPRLDTSPGANPANASYIAHTSNPALCLADYLTDTTIGMGETAARIDWDLVVAAANICDENVTVPTGGSPQSTTQDRYTCNVLLDATDRFEDNIEALCTAMMGHCYYSGGKWQIHAGVWTSSAFALTEDDIVGSMSVQADTPRNNKYNAVRGQYYDATRNYQPGEFQPRTSTAYETADGERIWREVEFRATTNEYEAQRKAIIILKRSRNRRSVTADFSMAAFKVKPFETGTLTVSEIGWSAKPVRCVGWEFRPEGTVRLTLVEETSTDWSDPALGDYTVPGSTTAPAVGAYAPPTPTSLTATSVTGGTLLEWTVPTALPPGSYYEILRHSASTPFSSATLLDQTTGTSFTALLNSPQTWYYWVRAVSPTGTRGTQYPATTGVLGGYRWVDTAGSTTSSGNAIGGQATGQAGTVQVTTGSGTLSVVVAPDGSVGSPVGCIAENGTAQTVYYGGTPITLTATPSGGTAPYTYSWTDTSSFVTVSSPTSASSGVTSSGTNVTRTVTITCTVTDSDSPQATATDTTYLSIVHSL